MEDIFRDSVDLLQSALTDDGVNNGKKYGGYAMLPLPQQKHPGPILLRNVLRKGLEKAL